jgi:hypothetical protein
MPKMHSIVLLASRWYYGFNPGEDSVLEQLLTPIASREGFHQGDVMANQVYNMSTFPFVLGLRDILGDDGLLRFFIDDGNMAGKHDDLRNALRYILDVGPQFGYHLNLSKGAYLMGKCGDRALAPTHYHL